MGVTRERRFFHQRPEFSLIGYFVAWKLLLLIIALASPGHGYDTSTSLAFESSLETSAPGSRPSNYYLASRFDIVEKLTRWDSIYFTKIAHDGYTFEQEWMAGFGFTNLLGLLSKFGTWSQSMKHASAIGIAVAHASHLISVLVLYHLGLLSLGKFAQPKRSSMAFLAACLHIISPAGIFLSAPYAESIFSAITFLGFYLYGKSLLPGHNAQKDLFLLSAGVCLGLATTIRANGLLNGLIFVNEAVTSTYAFIAGEQSRWEVAGRQLFVVFCAGAVMGGISLFPQYLAYSEYCIPQPKRPWCTKLMPSIYTWIQSEYWGVGFLNYWTLSNIPLFMLALPMLSILCISGGWAWTQTAPGMSQFRPSVQDLSRKRSQKANQSDRIDFERQFELPWRLVIPQIALALLGLTNYHVQIITRLSSGCPVWYWYLAEAIIQDGKRPMVGEKSFQIGSVVTRWMVIYAIIQAGLFASFLPPA